MLTGEERLTLTGHNATVGSLAFFADGQLLVSADDSGEIRLWRAEFPDENAR